MTRLLFSLVIAWLSAALPSDGVWALEILHVRSDRARTESPLERPVVVSFALSEPASARLRIYDARDLRVREIPGEGILGVGTHQLEWDGKAEDGTPVPPGAYAFVVAARSLEHGSVEVVHDLTDLTGGAAVRARQVSWSPSEGAIRYVLPTPSIVAVRVGLRGDGPLLRTVVDWLPRPAGPNSEPWDGMDSSGYIRLGAHDERDIAVSAYSLSDNSILVGRPAGKPEFVSVADDAAHRRPRASPGSVRRRSPAIQPADARRDIGITLRLVDHGDPDEDGVPRVRGRVPIQLTVAPDDQDRAVDRRFEAAFYVDGLKVFENEIGFFPMTWYWDAQHESPGVHYVTANLIGYEGNFGMSTLKLRVERPESGE